jgi:hypothetical protein
MDERELRQRTLDGLGPQESHPVARRASEPGLEPADERGTILAIMSGARRRGVWEPPERLRVLSLMGGVELDFREAEFLDGVTEVVILAVMGGVAIVAPPGVDVEADGVGLMGEFTHVTHRSPHPDSPVLRVRGFSLMGGVSVKIKQQA